MAKFSFILTYNAAIEVEVEADTYEAAFDQVKARPIDESDDITYSQEPDDIFCPDIP